MGKTKVKESKKPLTLSKVVVYILLILLAITIIIPVGWVFVASVKQNSEFYGSPWVLPEKIYFQNFIDAWEKASMGTYMLNSVIVTALALLLLIVISLPAAYVLSRFKFKTSKFWNVLFMAGLFINVSYIVVPIFLMLNNWDKTLRQLTGGFKTSKFWNVLFMAGLFINVSYIVVPIFLMLNNWDKTLRQLTGGTFFLNNLFVLALVYASTALPFTIYLLSGYFRSLAKDFEEAAYVDGASYFTTMVKIIFPMAKPSIVTVILFSFLSFWNEYIISMTLLTKPELKTLPVGLMNLMAAQKSAVQYGQMYAGLVIVMLPTLILYICVQKKLTQGMTLGGLKG